MRVDNVLRALFTGRYLQGDIESTLPLRGSRQRLSSLVHYTPSNFQDFSLRVLRVVKCVTKNKAALQCSAQRKPVFVSCVKSLQIVVNLQRIGIIIGVG